MANFVYQTTHIPQTPEGTRSFRAVPRWAVAPGLASLLLALLAATGCGGDGAGTEGGGDGSSTGGNGGGVNLGNGNGTTTHDGGTVALTPDQVAALLDAACTDTRSEGENLPSVLELVVDVSGSMDDDAPGSDDSKWEVTRDALLVALADLPDTTAVGVVFYPNMQVNLQQTARPVDACVNTDDAIPIATLGAAGSDQRTTIEDALNALEPESYTSTHDAYQYALDEHLVPYESNATKFMLLITDGAPTLSLGCIGTPGDGGGGGGMVVPVDPDPIVDAVGDAQTSSNVQTFVIGSPGSEEGPEGEDMRPWLSAAALAGGTDTAGCAADGPTFCHMDMTEEPDFAAALADGLASVVGQVIDACTFAFPADAGDAGTVSSDLTSVIITNEAGDATLILRDDIGECSEGWVLDGQGNIALCPTTCANVKASPGARVEIAFGCNSDDVITVR